MSYVALSPIIAEFLLSFKIFSSASYFMFSAVFVQLLSHVQLCSDPWTAAHQASLSFTNYLPEFELLMPSNHHILCSPFLLLPSIFLSIRIFSNESSPHIRWPKYWVFSFSISPSSEYSGLISLGLTGLISLLSKGLLRYFFSTTVQKHQFFSTQPSLWSNSYIHIWLSEKL